MASCMACPKGKFTPGVGASSCQAHAASASSAAISKGSVGGIVVGVLIILAAVGVAAFKYARVGRSIELTEALLDHSRTEVAQMKEIWRIDPNEIELGKKIDEGAYGEVWKGLWREFTVAVKKLKAMHLTDGDVTDEFHKEAKFLLTCRHANVVTFFGAGTWDGVPFLVSEFIANGSLGAYLKSTPGIPFSKKRVFLLDISNGMRYLHGVMHMHRDLKPANVLIDNDLRAKIADFGSIRGKLSARHSASEQRGSSISSSSKDSVSAAVDAYTVGVGTPLYMAPEVMDGSEYSFSADVWSFGVSAWEILYQRRPDLFTELKLAQPRGPFMAAFTLALKEGQRLPFANRERFPEKLVLLIEQCMHADPTDRPYFTDISKALETSEIVEF